MNLLPPDDLTPLRLHVSHSRNISNLRRRTTNITGHSHPRDHLPVPATVRDTLTASCSWWTIPVIFPFCSNVLEPAALCLWAIILCVLRQTGDTRGLHGLAKVKGKGRTLDIAPQVDIATTKALRYMARTKQRRTYLPYTILAIAGTHLPAPRGWRVE